MMERCMLSELLEVGDLPTLPEVMSRILETVEDASSSASDLTALLECDHAISARILRMANSAFYGLRNPVESVRQAVVVIGFDAVRDLALAASVFGTLASRQQVALDPEDFWMHAFGAAEAAQMVTGKHCPVESADGCFTAGLLHDIGKYILALVLKDEYREIVCAAQAPDASLRALEQATLNTTHVEVGQWIATKWRFPPMIIDVIGNLCGVAAYSGRFTTEVAVVALASHMSCKAEFGYAGEPRDAPLETAVLDVLGMPQAIVDELVEELAQLSSQTRRFLDDFSESGGMT